MLWNLRVWSSTKYFSLLHIFSIQCIAFNIDVSLVSMDPRDMINGAKDETVRHVQTDWNKDEQITENDENTKKPPGDLLGEKIIANVTIPSNASKEEILRPLGENDRPPQNSQVPIQDLEAIPVPAPISTLAILPVEEAVPVQNERQITQPHSGINFR